MEAQLVNLMEGLSGEFKELKESFKELKAENSALRKEILGIGASAASSGQKGMGLMEKTTLRELVEHIQFGVKTLNAKLERILQEEEGSVNGNKFSGEKQLGHDLCSADNRVDNTKEPVEYFPVVEIKLKTIAEQRDWMEKSFAESVKQRSVSEGASLGRSTVQAISSSIVPNPTAMSTSCTIKLSNHLSFALTDPSFYFRVGTKTSGPSKVDPHVSEVFTCQGPNDGGNCYFLSSFGISSSLRLTIYSRTNFAACIEFGMAFTPQDVPTDLNMYAKLKKMLSAPDVWMPSQYVTQPQEVIINHGKLHARGHMEPGRFSVIDIDIMKVSETESVPFPVHRKMKPLEDGESISASLTSTNLLHGSSLDKIACIVEIGNCLNVTLRNPNGFFRNSASNNFLPSQVLPFCRERFLASDDKTLEALFSYEIESTDLCLLVTLRAQSENNSFAVAFAQTPVRANIHELMALMNPKAWKTHLYKKYANAKDGQQVIQIRNIRAVVNMTEDTESLLSIRVFAV